MPTAVENRKVTILLELLSAGSAIDSKIVQFKDDIDLDMLQVRCIVLYFDVLLYSSIEACALPEGLPWC